jgi:hypothetical protein
MILALNNAQDPVTMARIKNQEKFISSNGAKNISCCYNNVTKVNSQAKWKTFQQIFSSKNWETENPSKIKRDNTLLNDLTK